MNQRKATRFPALLCLAVGHRAKLRMKRSKIFRTPFKNIYWLLIRWCKKGTSEKLKWRLRLCPDFLVLIIFVP